MIDQPKGSRIMLLSEQHETHRISHTGNAYERVFYEESSGEWFPLAQLRDGVRDRAERLIVANAWSQIEARLGWCRLPAQKPESGQRGSGRCDELL